MSFLQEQLTFNHSSMIDEVWASLTLKADLDIMEDGTSVLVVNPVANTINATCAPDDYRLLQPIWDLRLGYEDLFRSPLFPVILSVVFYFSFCFPIMMVDILCRNQAWYKRYKIQADKEVTFQVVYGALHLTFWNHILLILPTAVGQWIWTPPTVLPALAPTVFELVGQTVAGVFLFDFQFFLWHVPHHKIRFLYKTVHYVHHQYSSPFVWVTQYMHPWELLLVGILTTSNTWFFGSHPLTTWCYMLTMIVVTVEAHLGLDLPFLLHNFDPTGIIGGSPKHDMHHQKPMTNFGALFNHLDFLFGSYYPPMSAGGKKSKALQEHERRVQEGRDIIKI